MAHTPGPWRVGESRLVGDRRLSPVKRCAIPRVVDAQGDTVAEVFGDDDAPLIAAAPELMRVCRFTPLNDGRIFMLKMYDCNHAKAVKS